MASSLAAANSAIAFSATGVGLAQLDGFVRIQIFKRSIPN
jgi:hypothetical protein